MDSIEYTRRSQALKTAEGKGDVADSMKVRHALMERVRAGEITLQEAQAELAGLKKQARKDGQLIREDFYRD